MTDTTDPGTDVMLDLETMGSGPKAAIVAIGAVPFDLTTGRLGPCWYSAVDLASAVDAGGVIDAGTVHWWMQQSDEARAAISKGGPPIDVVLWSLHDWMGQLCSPAHVRVWGNGAAFDCVVLTSACRGSGVPVPWRYYNERCYRTVKALYPHVKLERVGTHHNAGDDAESQARHLMAMLRPAPVEVAA